MLPNGGGAADDQNRLTCVLPEAASPGSHEAGTRAHACLFIVQTAHGRRECERNGGRLIEGKVRWELGDNFGRDGRVLLEGCPPVVERALVQTVCDKVTKSRQTDNTDTYTLSPTVNSVTPSPRALMTPEESVPKTVG